MNPASAEGFLIHSRPWQDSSRIVEVFSLGLGRLPVVARGSRRQGRRQGQSASALQAFAELSFQLVGHGELKTLRSVETQRFFTLEGSALFAGFYLNELLERLLPRHVPEPDLYDHYKTTVMALAEDQLIEPALRSFEMAMLSILGFGIDFNEASGGPLQPTATYDYVAEIGFEPTKAGGASTLSGAVLKAIEARDWDAESLLAAKRLCRAALGPHLGGRPLRSRELFVKRGTP